MSAQVKIDASFGDGKPLAVLADLIKKRVDIIRRETTEGAVIATTITVLQSIRARTKVAKKKGVRVTVRECTELVPSFRSIGKARRVCIRRGKGGPVVDRPFKKCAAKISWSNVYEVEDLIVGKKYLLIADTKAMALEYAKTRAAYRIEKHGGMAKWAIGHAQSLVSQKPVSGNGETGEGRRIAGENVLVQKSKESGTFRGKFGIVVNDALRYAVSALRNGKADLDLAIMKAANSTAAKINKSFDKRLDETVETPFPEVTKKGA